MVINKNAIYLIGLSIALFFILAGASLLLIPHRLPSPFIGIPIWQNWILGFSYFLLGIFLSGGIFLNQSLTRQRITINAAAIGLAGICLHYAVNLHLTLETIFLATTAITFFIVIRRHAPAQGWHIHNLIFTNLISGLFTLLLFQPTHTPFAVDSIFTENNMLAAVFLLSAAINLITQQNPTLATTTRSKLLGLPWLIIALQNIFPLNYPTVLVASIAAFSGLMDRTFAWDKLVLREGFELGRRFFKIFGLTLALLLLLIAWFLLVADSNSPTQASNRPLREMAFIGFNLLYFMNLFMVATLHLSVNGLIAGLYGEQPTLPRPQDTDPLLQKVAQVLFQPFNISRDLLNKRLKKNQEYEDLLNKQMQTEKKRVAQLNLLHQINLELEQVLDPPVSAQLTANAVVQGLDGNLCGILEYDDENQELVVISSSGRHANHIPSGYRQNIQNGILGRAARLRRTQLVSDTRLDQEYVQVANHTALTELVVPITYAGHFKGVLIINHDQSHAFDDSDIRTLETIGLRLATSWNRADRDARLTQLIQAGISLSTTLEVEKVIHEIANITLQVVGARYVFVALVDKGGGFTRTASAGATSTLSSMLASDPEGNTLIQAILHQKEPLRIRDIRKRFISLPTGDPELRNLMGVPILMRNAAIGAILVFGKTNKSNFNDTDESLTTLIATQAGAAIETSWLYQEIRGMYNIATQLANLSFRVIQAEKINDAAIAIAEVTYQLSKASAAGIVIFDTSKQIASQIKIDSHGIQPNGSHPTALINQTMKSGQVIISSNKPELVHVCLPLHTPRRKNGVLWVELPEKVWNSPNYSDNLQTLANQAAIGLERSLLLMETRHQAGQLEDAYHKLEETYDQTLLALSSALDARDHETKGHSKRVAEIAFLLGKQLNMSEEQAKKMERGAILHDIGKIGISDDILLKPGPLTDAEWDAMRQHPDIGAKIVESVPFLHDALPVIQHHQERWDGSGYPAGLKGEEIPFMARVFAVVDAFDALTTERPYREKISHTEAVEYLNQHAGKLFDPAIVSAFETMVKKGLLNQNHD